MPRHDEIEFWFSIGSTYTYLTVSRLHQVAAARGVRFRWRPFSVRAIMQEMNNVPFATKPIKLDYMWRDVERRASLYGLPIRVPAPYPLKEFDLANRVAVLGQAEGWCADYVRAAYRRWFVEGKEAGSEPNLSESLAEIGQVPSRVIPLARSDAIGQAYATATEEARRLKIFGAPTFVTRGEVFWGDDRLDDAVAWHAHGKLSPVT
ncbi:MAG: 2-hydroxychromene-2-carboxylate isomerase [Hyphomicrobiaceae bacterium]|nr:MAG: 2-hydroxychromene-2-carboxylate isomerase [Hyphomicrobiaceae bacterium]